MRVEPPPCEWQLPDPWRADLGQDLVGFGADLAPGTVLQSYRMGLFPMHIDTGQLGWWSPDPRGILRLADLRVSRSLRKSTGQFEVTFDRDFNRVMRECGDSRRDGVWITEEFIAAYSTLHDMGWAHSIEVWSSDELVGGLYGIEVGGVFAGSPCSTVDVMHPKSPWLPLLIYCAPKVMKGSSMCSGAPNILPVLGR